MFIIVLQQQLCAYNDCIDGVISCGVGSWPLPYMGLSIFSHISVSCRCICTTCSDSRVIVVEEVIVLLWFIMYST